MELFQEELDREEKVVKESWNRVRSKRDAMLSSCDWTALNDIVLSDSKRDEWQTYRQALRDVTSQGDPDNVTWPEPPENESIWN